MRMDKDVHSYSAAGNMNDIFIQRNPVITNPVTMNFEAGKGTISLVILPR